MSFKSFRWSYCSYCSYFRSDCSHVAVNNGQRVFRSELSRLERKKMAVSFLSKESITE